MIIGNYSAALNFDLIREIGQEGRNSKVYLAHDKQLDGEVVVKQVRKGKLVGADEYFKEAKILYASSHPNVVKVNYGCYDDENIYIAMPYYKKGSLKRLIDSRFLTVREVIRYSIQFLSGLHNIHSKGLIHFDIKPDNILISDTNEALLSDFGLSKAMDQNGFAIQNQVYPKQIPPEVFNAGQKTLHYDIYLAGLTIYRMLNGNQHFQRQLEIPKEEYYQAVQNGNFPNKKSYMPHIPLKLQKIVNKALNLKITDRHQTVLELINELSSVNECLDWRYEFDGEIDKWEKVLDDKSYTLSLDKTDSDIVKIEMFKYMLNGGRRTKVHEFCRNDLNFKSYSKVLIDAFKKS